MPADLSRVLTIEGAGHSELQQRCRDWGFAAVATQSMWTAVSAVRADDFKAIVIDLESITDDILELVLNLRDINSVIPILVIGEPADNHLKQALHNRKGVHLLQEPTENKLERHALSVIENDETDTD